MQKIPYGAGAAEPRAVTDGRTSPGNPWLLALCDHRCVEPRKKKENKIIRQVRLVVRDWLSPGPAGTICPQSSLRISRYACAANGERGEVRHMISMCGRLHSRCVPRLGGTFDSADFLMF